MYEIALYSTSVLMGLCCIFLVRRTLSLQRETATILLELQARDFAKVLEQANVADANLTDTTYWDVKPRLIVTGIGEPLTAENRLASQEINLAAASPLNRLAA